MGKARKKNKLVMMRLGLATPKPIDDAVDFTSFFPVDNASSGSDHEPEASTTCSSPEQEQLVHCTSDEDELISSVIGSLGLEACESSPGGAQHVDKGPPGLKAPPNTPSYGSMLHEQGACKPCAWFWKPSGCQNGRDCAYCHICSDGELKARKKSKHAAMRLGLVTPKATPTSEQEARYALKLAVCF